MNILSDILSTVKDVGIAYIDMEGAKDELQTGVATTTATTGTATVSQGNNMFLMVAAGGLVAALGSVLLVKVL